MNLFLKTLLPLMWTSSSWAIVQSISNQEVLKHGRNIYETRCIGCHGQKGDGKGTAAVFLDPKPRDFTSGIFKFKSTPNESLPTDNDMMRVLSQGILGTSMPSFRLLPSVSKFAVIQYVKQFSSAWDKKENIMSPIQGAPFVRDHFTEYKQFIPKAKKGRALFLDNCVICHGRTGRGDGEGAEGLSDDWGHPIVPGDLTRPYIKSGKSIKDIYRVLLTGMAGTPMPSFKDALSDNELWDVAAYVLYLRGWKSGLYGANPPIGEITKEETQ